MVLLRPSVFSEVEMSKKPCPKEWFAYGWCRKCEHPLTLAESRHDPEVCYRCRKAKTSDKRTALPTLDLFSSRIDH